MVSHVSSKPSTQCFESFETRTAPRSEAGGALIVAIMVVVVLSMGLGTYLASLGNYRRLQEQRILDDRAVMAAEAGLATQIAILENQPSPPSSDATQTITLSAAEFAPFENVTANIHVQTFGASRFWTITSTAECNSAETRNLSVARRVQATLSQQNFSRYELFINDFGPVWTSGYVYFLGLGSVFMGPVNINTGCAFFPNFWSLSEVTSAAPKGIRTYADWGTYLAGVYGKGDARDYVNILNYMSSTYPNAPQFYGGFRNLPAPISLPDDMKVDLRSKQLRDNAGLILPDNYSGYVAAAGPNFVIDLSNPGGSSSQITVRQYLGTDKGSPVYGPSQVTNVTAVNGAIIVKGNIVSLKGVLNGRLTIGAFADGSNPNTGNIGITGDVQYQSRMDIPGFKYTDAPEVFTADGSGINQSYISTLQSQLDKVTDILGLVAEGDVMVKERDLDGKKVADDKKNPIYIDAVVMATGAATATSGDGGFGVESELTRKPGQAYFLGGMIENRQMDWALFNSSGITNGVNLTQLWDKRASEPGGAPPFFPSTGTLEVVPGTWNSTYVQHADDPIDYPTLP